MPVPSAVITITGRIAASSADVCGWIDRGSASTYSRRFWTLDPIDGTKGFLRRGQYAISLALVVDGTIVVAALGCPNLPSAGDNKQPPGLVLHAVRNRGSWAAPLDSPAEQPRRISVSQTVDASQARFCESLESGHSSHDLSALGGPFDASVGPFDATEGDDVEALISTPDAVRRTSRCESPRSEESLAQPLEVLPAFNR